MRSSPSAISIRTASRVGADLDTVLPGQALQWVAWFWVGQPAVQLLQEVFDREWRGQGVHCFLKFATLPRQALALLPGPGTVRLLVLVHPLPVELSVGHPVAAQLDQQALAPVHGPLDPWLADRLDHGPAALHIEHA